MSLVKIEGTKFIRDTDNMALINKDANGMNDYKMRRNMLASQRKEIENMKEELSDIKQDMSEIKQLLLDIAKKD